ncbi:hypothetical protein N0V90_012123 [Kalmusia sp. IMI 367209]|nr:hypothetical protein N0V90_012123 [Kalmusia sp. IMI 367209]
MGDPQPAISLYLDGELSFQLHRKGFAGTIPTLKLQMHDNKNPATLVIDGYRSSEKNFSLTHAIQRGLFELFDAETNTKIAVPQVNEEIEAGKMVVPAGARNQWFDLKIDAREDFWTQLLTPGHKYEIRWAKSGHEPRAYHGETEEVSEETNRLSVRCLPRPIKLTVFDDATAPPQFSLSLTPTAKICHLSGEPRFGFSLEVTSHEAEVITVCLHKTPLKELHGLEEIAKVEDVETDEEVEWPYGIGCYDGPESFPSNDFFEEFEPGVPYQRTFYLEKYDKKTSNGGELEALESGSIYKVEVSKDLLRAFTKWRKGRKGDLLGSDQKENEARWKGNSGQIILEVSNPFTFETA